METDTRPHRVLSTAATANNNTSGELFICFTSRLSASSSMKMPSKSILSPGRARDSSHISLSSSLSRRLRTNGSLKGGGQASPMFPSSNGKKRGSGFENPEPSSPKVTCIGQVRVKTKKQARKNRAGTTTRSKSRREVSFRKLDTTGVGNAVAGVGNGGLELPTYQFQEGLPANRNQRWVHFPVTICEALRGFGAEFNCFLPCKSSCMAGERGKDEKINGSSDGGGSSCGAVLRWLVTVPDSQGKNSRDIELLVGAGEEEEDEANRRSSQRRHVFEGLDIENFVKEGKFTEHSSVEDEEEGRVSICIPPKNALLLMRCRSDPVKMAALANKFWECPQDGVFKEEQEPESDHSNNKEEEEKMGIEDHCNSPQENNKVEIFIDHEEKIEEPKQVCEEFDSCEYSIEEQRNGEEWSGVLEEGGFGHEENESIVCEQEECQQNEKETVETVDNEQVEEEIEVNCDVLIQESVVDPENPRNREDELDEVMVTQENACSPLEEVGEPAEEVLREEVELVVADDDTIESDISNSCTDPIEAEEESEFHGEEYSESLVEEQKIEQEQVFEETEVEAVESSEEESQSGETYEEAQSELDPKMQEPETNSRPEPIEDNSKQNEKSTGLPDCLLLMMCEPKLSMEVSKETWVCGTDFIRWLPERPQMQKSKAVNRTETRVNSQNRDSKKRPSIDSKPNNFQLQQPPRSSCSFPAAPPSKAVPRGGSASTMASMVEQKLAGSRAYEPCVLTRCKSEPMRTSSKLAPEACFWKNRKLEPHRPAATLGVGAAAGLGF